MSNFPHTFRAMVARTNFFPDYVGKISVRRERLNSGGYTADGTYFGVGSPLYFVQDEDGHCLPHGHYFRAQDREDAVAIARRMFPKGKIRK